MGEDESRREHYGERTLHRRKSAFSLKGDIRAGGERQKIKGAPLNTKRDPAPLL